MRMRKEKPRMNRTLRVLTAALCAALVLAMPFFLSSPAMLGEVKW